MSRWAPKAKKKLTRSTRGLVAPLDASGRVNMTQVLMEFAKPLFDLLSGPLTAHRVHQGLKVAKFAWNLPLFERLDGRSGAPSARASYDEQIAKTPEGKALLEGLMAARVARWGDDPRAVADVVVKEGGGEIEVTVSSYMPGGKAGEGK